MKFIGDIFNIFLYQPLFNLLMIFYLYVPGHDFGVAIILLTLLIKLILFPLNQKAIRAQKVFADLQPKLKELQEKYKNDKETQAKEMMELYKREKINPFASMLPLFIQLPVLIALYKVFWSGLQADQMMYLYKFMPTGFMVDPFFFNLVDLSQPNIYMAIVAAISQFLQVKFFNPAKVTSKKDPSAMMQNMLPIITLVILFRLPAAIGLYWVATNVFTIFQQYYFIKKEKKN